MRDGHEWTLHDVEEAHTRWPESFEIPDALVRARLAPGDVAKLLFEGRDAAGQPTVERMWVEVLRRDGDGYIGVLRNAPAVLRGEPPALVAFAPCHVGAAGWRT